VTSRNLQPRHDLGFVMAYCAKWKVGKNYGTAEIAGVDKCGSRRGGGYRRSKSTR